MLQTRYNTEEKPLESLKARSYFGKFLRDGAMEYKEDKEVVRITAEALEELRKSHIGIPVIINHTDLTETNLSKHKVGSVANVFLNDKGFTDSFGKHHSADNWLWCNFVVEDESAIDLLDNQGWELSNSYSPIEVDDEKGLANKKIIGGEGLHLAIVPKGRYETKVVRNNSVQETNHNNKSILNMKEETLIKALTGAVKKIFNNSEYKEGEEDPKKEAKEKEKDNKKNNTKDEADKKDNANQEIEKQEIGEGRPYYNKYCKMENGEKMSVEDLINSYNEDLITEREDYLTLEEEIEIDGRKIKMEELVNRYNAKMNARHNEQSEKTPLDVDVAEGAEDKSHANYVHITAKPVNNRRNNAESGWNKIEQGKQEFSKRIVEEAKSDKKVIESPFSTQERAVNATRSKNNNQ